MGVYSVHLVGESRYQDAIRDLRAGERVELVPEPGNRHDPRAVKAVDLAGETIGYLERGSWVTRVLLDDGTAVSATIEDIIGGSRGKPSRGVVLSVRTGVHADAAGARSATRMGGSADRPIGSRRGGLKWWHWAAAALVLLAAFNVLSDEDAPAPAEDVAG